MRNEHAYIGTKPQRTDRTTEVAMTPPSRWVPAGVVAPKHPGPRCRQQVGNWYIMIGKTARKFSWEDRGNEQICRKWWEEELDATGYKETLERQAALRECTTSRTNAGEPFWI